LGQVVYRLDARVEEDAARIDAVRLRTMTP
jgi:hypothetical protein